MRLKVSTTCDMAQAVRRLESGLRIWDIGEREAGVSAEEPLRIRQHTSADVSIRQHTSAYATYGYRRKRGRSVSFVFSSASDVYAIHDYAAKIRFS